nr:hypothetical protein [Tanacetum cinerariifolium]
MDSFQGLRKVPHHDDGMLYDKDTEESWESIENLALYDNETQETSQNQIDNDKGIESNEVVDKNVVEPIELGDKKEEMDDESDNESNGRISKDVLIDVAGFVCLVDFVILDIEEDECMSLISGTPFLTTAKAEIKFDKGTMTIKDGKYKIGFVRTSEFPSKI